ASTRPNPRRSQFCSWLLGSSLLLFHRSPITDHPAQKPSQLVVIDGAESRRLLVFGDAAFEEVGLLLDIHHFSQPREGIRHAFVERSEAAGNEAAVGDVVDV